MKIYIYLLTYNPILITAYSNIFLIFYFISKYIPIFTLWFHPFAPSAADPYIPFDSLFVLCFMVKVKLVPCHLPLVLSHVSHPLVYVVRSMSLIGHVYAQTAAVSVCPIYPPPPPLLIWIDLPPPPRKLYLQSPLLPDIHFFVM